MIRVVSYGLGPIGMAAARLASRKQGISLVGAIDVDPAKAGKSLSEVLGVEVAGDPVIDADADACLARLRPDAVLHCTSSFLPVVRDQLLGLARAGVNVVSSTEELLLPDLQRPEIAAELDAAAKASGATLLGTGVNPGFAMDFMAVIASGVTADVQRVRCVRVVDAGTRRLPLQRKVGASLTKEQFAEQERTGRFGHIGMRESVALVARALALDVDEIDQTLEPVFAERRMKTPHLEVPSGSVAGIHNVGLGRRQSEVVIELDLYMYVGASKPRDEVFLFGEPNVHLRFEGGIPGDQATVAVLVNSLPQVVAAEPGVKTVLELPPPRLLR